MSLFYGECIKTRLSEREGMLLRLAAAHKSHPLYRSNIIVAIEFQNLASKDEADSVLTDLDAIGTHPFMISVLLQSGQVREFTIAPSAQPPVVNNQGSSTGPGASGKVDIWVFIVVTIGIIVVGVTAACEFDSLSLS